MHILFVHHNFPAQFGHIAAHLVIRHGFRCTFASEKPPGNTAGVERIRYEAQGIATDKSHYCSRTFENQIRRSYGLYQALKDRKDLKPDLIVGHSGFVSTLYLRELFDCPIINYFEYFYHTTDSDLDFRRDLPPCDRDALLRARTRNATLLLDLDNCDAGYAPTQWQRSRLPEEFLSKIDVIFDGIDPNVWRPLSDVPRRVAAWTLPPDKRIVTYVSRGMEAMRGFDIFMKVARRLCDLRSDVIFLVVGEDRVAYGGDGRFTGGKTFKQWVLDQDEYDLSRILFTGRVPPAELAQVFSLSDLHIYLTAPFVLSWSLMNALSCGATVLASGTPPVKEMVRDQQNGLLFDFFDIDQIVHRANEVLDDPPAFRHLGAAGVEMIHQHYTMEKCLPKMLELYRRTARKE